MMRRLWLPAALGFLLLAGRPSLAQFNYDTNGNAKTTVCNSSGVCLTIDGSGNLSIKDSGTGGSGITICSSAVGLTGWLSCIYNAVLNLGFVNTNQLKVTLYSATGTALTVDANGRIAGKICDSTTSTQCAAIDANGVLAAKVCDQATTTTCASVNGSHEQLVIEHNSATINSFLSTLAGGVSGSIYQINLSQVGGSSPSATNGLPTYTIPNANLLYFQSGLVNSSTTTKLISHSGTTKIFFFDGTGINSASISAAKWQLEYGAQTTNPCDTGTVTLMPAALSFANSTANQANVMVGSVAGAGILYVSPGSYVSIPSGDDLCVVTSGATNSEYFVGHYLQQ